MAARRITIFDTTLRDGEQSPGIALQPHEKAEIATQLERLGVDVVEAGFAVSSPGDFEGVRAVAAAVERPAVASLARTARKTSTPPRKRSPTRGAPHPRLHRDEPDPHGEEAPARARRGGRAGPLGRRLRATPRRTRSSSPARTRPARTRASSPRSAARPSRPARRRSTSPTRSATACRRSTRASCSRSSTSAPSSRSVSLSVHCHNDLGLAVANSLAAVRAGATQIEATINGLGERAGNAALEEIVMALRVRRDASRSRPASSSARSARRRISSRS